MEEERLRELREERDDVCFTSFYLIILIDQKLFIDPLAVGSVPLVSF